MNPVTRSGGTGTSFFNTVFGATPKVGDSVKLIDYMQKTLEGKAKLDKYVKEWNEKGIVVKGPENLMGKAVVAVSEDFYRPTDVVNLWGDPTKAKAKLKWNPNKTSFEELVKLMVESDMAKVASEDAAMKVRTNLAEYLEKGIVK